MCYPRELPPSSVIALEPPPSSDKASKDARPRQKNNKKNNKKNTLNHRRRCLAKGDSMIVSSDETTCTVSTIPSDESIDCDSLSFTLNDQLHHTQSQHSLVVLTKKKPKQKRHQRKSKQTRPTQKIELDELTPAEKSNYIALDAEMVGILNHLGYPDSALARITLLTWDGDILFDSHVQVPHPIIDYRTFVSGILPQHLTPDSALPPLEVRRIVGGLIHDKVIVGHGLGNDLRALGLHHPWHMIRDTARYEPFMKPSSFGGWEARKLKILAANKLGLEIQREGVPHDPVEDAVAALELFKKHRVKWERCVEWKVEKTREMEAGMGMR